MNAHDTITLAPRTLTEAKDLAKSIHGSSLLPAALKRTEADVLVTVLTGQELGLLPMQSMRAIHVIEGKPTLSADAMAAIILASPVCEYFRVTKWTHDSCVVEAKRKNDPPLIVEWTLKDAQTAQLLGKDVWKKYPRAMLRARAISSAAHNVFPDIILGVYTPEELSPNDAREVNERPASAPPAARPVVIDVEPVEPSAPVEPAEPMAPAAYVGMPESERIAQAIADQMHREAADRPRPPTPTPAGPPPAAVPNSETAALGRERIAGAKTMAELSKVGTDLIKLPDWKTANLKEAFTRRQQELVSAEKAEAARGAA